MTAARFFILHDYWLFILLSPKSTHCMCTLVTVLPTRIFTWTSAASPGPAPSRNEAFRFSSWKTKFGGFNYVHYCFWHSKYLSRDDTAKAEGRIIYLFFYSSPFLGGPWLLVWGKVEGWVYISGFCQLSSFGFHRWMEAIQKSSRTETIVSNSSRWMKVLLSSAMLPLDRLWTYCSRQHVVHESSQTPPVHCPVMSAPH